MTGHRKPASHALILVPLLCLVTTVALGQEAAPSGDVASALTALKQAPDYERAAKRVPIVALGDAAVDPLIAEVEKLPTSADIGYVGNCILALGELKAQRATDVLMVALESSKMQIVYWAAFALGDIWEGKGTTENQARLANASLLGAVYSDVPPVNTLGPALALVKINGIPINRPESVALAQLAEQVAAWFDANSAALPPPEQRPWQVNLRTLFASSDEAARQAALQALRASGNLGPIEQTLAALSDEESAPESVRGDLEQLLGDLTGVPFPPAGVDPSAGAEAAVTTWRWQWFNKLSRQSDAKYVLYAWGQLENSLRFYADSPSEDAATPVKFYRAALLYQLPNAAAIPAGASPKAATLLSKPLGVKKRIADSLAVLEGDPSSSDKANQLSVIEDETRPKANRGIGVLFLGRLARLARNEGNTNFARQLGAILSQVSGVPCDLDRTSIERRQEQLTQWENQVKEQGFLLEVPE